MLDVILGADVLEGLGPEQFSTLDRQLDFSRVRTVFLDEVKWFPSIARRKMDWREDRERNSSVGSRELALLVPDFLRI